LHSAHKKKEEGKEGEDLHFSVKKGSKKSMHKKTRMFKENCSSPMKKKGEKKRILRVKEHRCDTN